MKIFKKKGFDLFNDSLKPLIDIAVKEQKIMKDEIKEILDYWNFYINEPNNYKLLNVHFDEIKKVLDYITNLQEENERLKEKLKNRPIVDFTFDVYKELENYKSRCEKAIEHIKEHQLIYTSQYEEESNFDNHLLDILDGGDE